VRGRGGFTIDLEWADGQLSQATFRSELGKPARVRYGDVVKTFDVAQGQSVTWDGK
jgi:hypothetical protein